MKWHNKWSLTNIGGFTFYWVRYVLAALALLWLTLLALVFLQQDIASCPTAKVQRFTESGGQLNYLNIYLIAFMLKTLSGSTKIKKINHTKNTYEVQTLI